MYQAVSTQAVAIHDMFVSTIVGSGGSYATTEDANAIAATWENGGCRNESSSNGFGALSPEIDFAKMSFGSGSRLMLAAAVAWDGLAAQLHSAAASYSSVISD